MGTRPRYWLIRTKVGLVARVVAPRPRTSPRMKQVFPAPSSPTRDRKSTRLNSSHLVISYAVFCLKKKKIDLQITRRVNHRISEKSTFFLNVSKSHRIPNCVKNSARHLSNTRLYCTYTRINDRLMI